jgi:hypothetical protein
MTDKINRSRNFFRDIILKEDKTIYADDIDSQFNEVTDYFNDVLKPAIDTLVSEAVQGIAGNTGAFLHNIGDGSTDWQYVNSDRLDDFSITFEKLVKHTTSSVLIADASGGLSVVPANSSNEVLICREANTPIWQLVTSDHIEPKTLTGQQLGVLSMENFVQNQFITNLVANVITTAKIPDLNITNDKLLDGSITYDKLGIFSNLPAIPAGLRLSSDTIVSGAITSDKIKDNTIPIASYQPQAGVNGYYMELWSNIFGTAFDSGVPYPQILKSQNLQDNTIDDSFFETPNYLDNHYPEYLKAKAFFPDVPLAFQFQSDHIALDSLDLGAFDDEVKAAINWL